MTTLERIRQKCIEANPEKNWVKEVVDADGGEIHPSLSDVLNALLEESRGILSHEHGGMTPHQWRNERWLEVIYEWNLLQDDLSKQSIETIEFIGKVLDV